MGKNTGIKREPTPPGVILREKLLKPLGISRRELAEYLGWSVRQVDRICDNEAAITPEKAVPLGLAFNIRPEFWLKAQAAYDLWRLRGLWDARSPLADGSGFVKKVKIINFPRPRHGIRKYFFADMKIGEWEYFEAHPEKVKNRQAIIHSTISQYNRRYNRNILVITRRTETGFKICRVR